MSFCLTWFQIFHKFSLTPPDRSWKIFCDSAFVFRLMLKEASHIHTAFSMQVIKKTQCNNVVMTSNKAVTAGPVTSPPTSQVVPLPVLFLLELQSNWINLKQQLIFLKENELSFFCTFKDQSEGPLVGQLWPASLTFDTPVHQWYQNMRTKRDMRKKRDCVAVFETSIADHL